MLAHWVNMQHVKSDLDKGGVIGTAVGREIIADWESRGERLNRLLSAVKTFIDLSPTALDTSELEAAMRIARGW